MATPVTLTATTLEGQLLQLIEAVTNAQVAAIAASPNPTTVRKIITANTTDDLGSVKNVTLALPVAVNVNTAGTATEAQVVYP